MHNASSCVLGFSHTVRKLTYASVCVSVCSLYCTEEVTNYAGMCSPVRCFLICRWNVRESSLISPCYLFLPAEVSLSLAHSHTHIEISSWYTLVVLSLCFWPVGTVCSHLGNSYMLVNTHHWVMPRWGHPFVFFSLSFLKNKRGMFSPGSGTSLIKSHWRTNLKNAVHCDFVCCARFPQIFIT